MVIGTAEIEAAAGRIAGHVVRTPTVPSPGLSALLGAPVTAKLELLQRTGSFKARGAVAKLLSLSEAERAAGVVAVSGGNHGIAVAVMAAALDVKSTVVMPRSAPARAVEVAETAGASVRLADDMDGAFALTTRLRQEGLTLVHPFDDPVVIAGQGTVGLEFADDAGDLTDVLVSIGGGGLISGVAAALRPGGPGSGSGGGDGRRPGDVRGPRGGRTGAGRAVLDRLHAQCPGRFAVDVRACVGAGHRGAGGVRPGGRAGFARPGGPRQGVDRAAAGCLLPAARRVLERVGEGARIGLVVCGGNATTGDMIAWASRFGLR